ncbi:MBL fold metallo-hydrolase [Paenibacillus sp. J5C_2022]|uniref:MBL fold metallo-hydrolase n=1 Tax=Paenibacillus sp. J5C2022 TaxID=2977129 RepID=UPI0021CEEC18|nr:MBL fold metallo-hydrolase [Paenibacillus sp. J5C2022]MCU6709235.1 MBL fold metallo-hydrolase [Paenibacillus sp. J5C2022]
MRAIHTLSVVQLTYMPRLFPVNCYLVEEEDSVTLIDAALPNNVGAILQAAESIGKPIGHIVLTHAHSDHVGALDGLKQRLPHVPVLISRRDARLLAGDKTLAHDEPDKPIRGAVPSTITTKPDSLLEDGDLVGSLRAIATPGHTPGSMSFLDERNGIVIAGDAFQTRGGIAVSGQMRWTFPFPAMATWSPELALQSAKKLAALSPSVLAVGHGNMLEQPLAEMERAIARAERTLDSGRREHNVT